MIENDITYPKKEKLKAKTHIDELFVSGKSVSKYPLRMVYTKLDDLEEQDLQVGVSVSKRNFKKAVDRNYFKRLLREVYRTNKHLIKDAITDKYAIMFFYQSRDKLTYEEINIKMIKLIEKFILQLQEDENKPELI